MKIYLDTNTWIRLFEQGNTIVNLQCDAVGDILNQNFDIISSKFQIRQFSHLIKHEPNIDKKQNYQYGKDLCELTCSKSIQEFTPCTTEARQLIKKTMMNDYEDALQIVIASIRGAEYFITADNELYTTKKQIIEKSLTTIFPVNTYTHNLQILDPIQFKKITNI